jgi:hypothetical protein
MASFFTITESPGEVAFFNIARNGSLIQGTNFGFTAFGISNETGSGSASIVHLDSPGTTSLITYVVYFRSRDGNTVGMVNGSGNQGKNSSFTVFEILPSI